MTWLKRIFKKFIKLIFSLLALGLPIFIYFGFIKQEPIFDPEYDLKIGKETVYSIQKDSINNPVLIELDYPESYAYLRTMVNEITKSNSIKYASLFKYDSIKIIQRDDVLNAFCTPGGYIYVYSGLIKYLNQPDHLAGVIGHEIAHAELRHSAIRLQKEFGREKITDFILFSGAGIGGYLKAKILSKVLSLDYSRAQETAADEMSVIYLSDTRYSCDGVGGFFSLLMERGDESDFPEILSDHPNSSKRIKAINATVQSLECGTKTNDLESWIEFQNSLPVENSKTMDK